MIRQVKNQGGFTKVLMRKIRKERWRHLFYVQLVLTLSVILFAFGPIDYDISNKIMLYVYLFAAQLFFVIGYTQYNWKSARPWRFVFPIKVIVVGGAIISIVYVTLYMATKPNLPSLVESMTDFGLAYQMKTDPTIYGESKILNVFYSALSPFVFLSLPILIVYWSKFRTHVRILVIMGVLMGASMWIRIGTNAGIGYLVVTCVSSIMLRNSFIRMNGNVHTKQKKMKLISKLGLFVLILGFFWFFSSTITSRVGEGIQYYDVSTGATLKAEHPLVKIMPESLFSFGIYYFIGYWVHGYHGLSLCLDQDFVFAYGVGHSKVLLDLSRQLGYDHEKLNNLTYMARNESATGYPDGYKWHSIYPALASDLTFIGALFVMIISGMLFSIITKEAIMDHNPFAIGLYSHLWIMILFIPANNQLANDKMLYFSFIGTLFLWLLSRRNKRPLTMASCWGATPHQGIALEKCSKK